jgi:ribosomal protein S4
MSEYFKRIDETSPASENGASWLKVDRKKLVVGVSGIPSRDDAETDINEQLIVEYYSR